MPEEAGPLTNETALAISTGMEAIAAHADGLLEREILSPTSRARIETMRMIARSTLELVRSTSSVSQVLDSPDDVAQRATTYETILVVEDAVAVRQLIARVLRARGYWVIEARNGEDAIERLSQHAAPIDLVLTDVNMPGMSGGELFDQLRGWYPLLRVLFMSGHDAGQVATRLVDEPRTGFIPKPFIVEDLTAAIRELMHRE